MPSFASIGPMTRSMPVVDARARPARRRRRTRGGRGTPAGRPGVSFGPSHPTATISAKPSRSDSMSTSGSGTAAVSVTIPMQHELQCDTQRHVDGGARRRRERVEAFDRGAADEHGDRRAGHVRRDEVDALQHPAEQRGRRRGRAAGSARRRASTVSRSAGSARQPRTSVPIAVIRAAGSSIAAGTGNRTGANWLPPES